ncbi:MAG: nuclear transport factor 2 family protein [Chloroflexi bacterium]|nr:nuclear transport factor 2 family protein [Chloroflexota bacterium]
MDIDDVRTLLQKFQEGYIARNPENLPWFMDLFGPDDTLEVIGTNAVTPGDDEWCRGRAATQALIESDWRYWGDIRFDVAGANIATQGEVAWLSTTGTVTDVIPYSDRYEGYLAYVADTLEEEGVKPKEAMLDIIRLGNDILAGLQLPERCVWPFRFTAVAVKSGGVWRFQQMQYSFATTRSPDVRHS